MSTKFNPPNISPSASVVKGAKKSSSQNVRLAKAERDRLVTALIPSFLAEVSFHKASGLKSSSAYEFAARHFGYKSYNSLLAAARINAGSPALPLGDK